MTITIQLTLAQALALSRAAGNTVDYDDAMEAVFSNPSERAACYRAARKLDDAIRAVRGWSR